MKLGLFMMPLHPSYREVADCYDRDIDQLVLADKVGFDEAWLGEHFSEKWENAPAPDLLIAKALALTERIKFGTGVTLLGMHEPVYLAHRVAMLDHLARGRFQWGIGLGGIPTDMALMGLDPSEGRARAAEALRAAARGAESLRDDERRARAAATRSPTPSSRRAAEGPRARASAAGTTRWR